MMYKIEILEHDSEIENGYRLKETLLFYTIDAAVKYRDKLTLRQQPWPKYEEFTHPKATSEYD